MFPMSLFVQVSSLPMADKGAEVRKWFEKILSDHKRQGSPHYIHDLALSDVATIDPSTGISTFAKDQLNVIKNYLSYFGNVFVGTVLINHADPYSSGIQDETFRWKNISASREAAARYVEYLKDSQINMPVHWYISYEADLNRLTDDGIKEAYKAYIKQLTEDLAEINVREGLNPNPSFLWSPAFHTRFHAVSDADKNKLASNLRNLFAGAPRLNWLHFQDFVGQPAKRQSNGSIHYDFTADDAIGYFSEVLVPANSSLQLKSCLVNMELFVSDAINPLSLHPGDPMEQSERHCAYRRAGIPVGFSWEIRWWYRSLYGD